MSESETTSKSFALAFVNQQTAAFKNVLCIIIIEHDLCNIATVPSKQIYFVQASILRLREFDTKITFLYPPHRGYISFVNTFVTHRNNDLGPCVP